METLNESSLHGGCFFCVLPPTLSAFSYRAGLTDSTFASYLVFDLASNLVGEVDADLTSVDGWCQCLNLAHGRRSCLASAPLAGYQDRKEKNCPGQLIP